MPLEGGERMAKKAVKKDCKQSTKAKPMLTMDMEAMEYQKSIKNKEAKR